MPRPALPGADRPLTAGEAAIAESMFGGAVDLACVRLHHAKWFALQPAWVVMAPDGGIWFHPNGYLWRDDFAVADLDLRALLVHELVHVWQHQSGICLPLRRPPFARYGYRLKPGKRFARYGLEQQARIVEDAYRARESGRDTAGYAAVMPFPSMTRRSPLTA